MSPSSVPSSTTTATAGPGVTVELYLTLQLVLCILASTDGAVETTWAPLPSPLGSLWPWATSLG